MVFHQKDTVNVGVRPPSFIAVTPDKSCEVGPEVGPFRSQAAARSSQADQILDGVYKLVKPLINIPLYPGRLGLLRGRISMRH